MTVDDLIAAPQYRLGEEERCAALLPILRRQVAQAAAANIHVAAFLEWSGTDPAALSAPADAPPIPVRMFKSFDLRTCPSERIARVVQSSVTTGGEPSVVPLDKTTAMRQSKALTATLKSFLGDRRMPFLVADSPTTNAAGLERLSARGAAIRGLSGFASRIVYLLEDDGAGLRPAPDRLEELAGLEDQDVYVFGFTYILWTVLRPHLQAAGRRIRCRSVRILHSGGWKRLTAQSVGKELFNREVGGLFDASSVEVIDFYGMAEQVGLIFPDCPMGNKHVPHFAHVIIRHPTTMEECLPGRPGLIEVMSVLAESYFGQALLTEDMGVLGGLDGCPCGRRGRHFRFLSRVERAEVRGCGDTFAMRARP